MVFFGKFRRDLDFKLNLFDQTLAERAGVQTLHDPHTLW